VSSFFFCSVFGDGGVGGGVSGDGSDGTKPLSFSLLSPSYRRVQLVGELVQLTRACACHGIGVDARAEPRRLDLDGHGSVSRKEERREEEKRRRRRERRNENGKKDKNQPLQNIRSKKEN
jgi:hypothetical protein